MTKKLSPSALMAVNGVNGQAVCDCGSVEFLVGIAITKNGNNFVRVLECVTCYHQLQVVHRSDAQVAPAIVS